MQSNLWEAWTKVTSELPWGVQKVFHDVFVLASEEKTTLIYNADFRDGNPCLVNTVGVMLKATGGKSGSGLPMQHFHSVVDLFDRINTSLENESVNMRPGYVSPFAAELFLHYFAELKDKPVAAEVNEAMAAEAFANNVYVERTDEDIAREMIQAFMQEAPCEMDLGMFSSGSNDQETITAQIPSDTSTRYPDN